MICPAKFFYDLFSLESENEMAIVANQLRPLGAVHQRYRVHIP
jgi:hypothetical protein